jgi:DNA-binding transcriptional LysR family regulator
VSPTGNGNRGDWTTSAIELREVRAFLLVLAEELNFARTAERLGVTHSRISQIIRLLETRVGGRLFERTSRRVRLTPVGERLRDSLAQPYAELERGFADARDVAGTLRIGMYLRVNCGPDWLEIVRLFNARHQACDVEIVDTKVDRDYLEVLRRGEVDMLASRLPLSDAPTRASKTR